MWQIKRLQNLNTAVRSRIANRQLISERSTGSQPSRRNAAYLAAALALGLTLGITSCAPSRNSATDDTVESAQPADPTAESSQAEGAPENEELAADVQEAAARAEWEAQVKLVNEVVSESDRATLIGGSPTKGPEDAQVILFKFSDFECPYCAVASADMKTFTDNHADDVLYVYKHFPLVTIHDEALPAAKAAWAAQQQDQFWLYHDGLFAFQEQLSEDYYVELAQQIGLDMEQFERDRNSPEAEAAVEADVELARALELGGTPSFIMTTIDQSLILPGGAPLEIYDEVVERMKNGTALN